MRIEFQQAQKARQKREEKFEPSQETVQGVLTALDYTDDARVAAMPGRVWMRPFGQDETPPIPVLNRRVPTTRPGLRVVARRGPKAPFEWEIWDWDTGQIDLRDDYRGEPLVTPHASSHQPGGDDPLYIYLRSLVPLRCSVQTGLKVQIAPYTYRYRGQLKQWPGINNYDLAAHLPGAGLARYVLVYLDPAANQLAVLLGATAVDTPTVDPVRPEPPARSRPSAWIRLAGGQVQLTELDIRDCRLLFGEEYEARPGVAARLYLHDNYS